jgi:hypothetical protein
MQDWPPLPEELEDVGGPLDDPEGPLLLDGPEEDDGAEELELLGLTQGFNWMVLGQEHKAESSLSLLAVSGKEQSTEYAE